MCVLCFYVFFRPPQIPSACSHICTRACLNVCSFGLFRMQSISPVGTLNTLMGFLWRVREVLKRCLSEGHIACGVSRDTCPMIMFMKIITGLGSRRVLSLENSRGLNFKLYCYPWKKNWRRCGLRAWETSVQFRRCLYS